jgi:hypothetical protein
MAGDLVSVHMHAVMNGFRLLFFVSVHVDAARNGLRPFVCLFRCMFAQ